VALAVSEFRPLNVPLSKNIFELIKGAPGIQRKTLALTLGVTEKTVSRYISELVSSRKIERRGSKKTGGYWAL
jgi:predicted HTH transcriptional regulator